ncbi:hypothetical protein JHK87_050447 [Glycine soja]|nr:hypothetical protein JHK87_050447 [Glycine soja]
MDNDNSIFDGKVRSKCKYCLKDHVGGDNKNETSTLQRHMGKYDVTYQLRPRREVAAKTKAKAGQRSFFGLATRGGATKEEGTLTHYD